MKTWATTIYARSPKDGSIKEYCGPNVPGITKKDAEAYCEDNALGYCFVVGELMAEVPCDENHVVDFSKRVDYDHENN